MLCLRSLLLRLDQPRLNKLVQPLLIIFVIERGIEGVLANDLGILGWVIAERNDASG